MEIISNEVIYSDKDNVYAGYFAKSASQSLHHTLILVVHTFAGRNAFICAKVNEFASQGYMSFAVDLYGKDVAAQQNIELNRAHFNNLLNNRQLLKERLMLSFTQAISLEKNKIKKVIAIGYCFGGLCVLDMARHGFLIDAAISVHGLLTPLQEPSQDAVKAKILVLHGFKDPMISNKDIIDFQNEMTRKNVDWQFHLFGQSMHGFSIPNKNNPESGLLFDPIADMRSTLMIKNFIDECRET